MAEKAFEVRVSDSLLSYGLTRNEIQHRIAEWMVFSLFTEGHVSSGRAARLLNMSRVEFICLLNARGIAYINYTPEELEEEFEAVRTLNVRNL